MDRAIISNSGLIINNKIIENQIQNKNIRTNIIFITSALASMVNDKPDREEVSSDVHKIKIADKSDYKSNGFENYYLDIILKKNLKRFNEYFKIMKKKINNYHLIFKDFGICNLIKCGALINKKGIIYRKMGINDPHIQDFDRDFLGFFLNISFNGKIAFGFEKEIVDKLKFNISGIPLLCMKSENAFINKESREICIEMAKHFSFISNEIIFC